MSNALSDGLAGELGPSGLAEVALRLLHNLVELQPAEGEGGRLLHPLPLVHRLLAGPTCLPHLAQVSMLFGAHDQCCMPDGRTNAVCTSAVTRLSSELIYGETVVTSNGAGPVLLDRLRDLSALVLPKPAIGYCTSDCLLP